MAYKEKIEMMEKINTLSQQVCDLKCVGKLYKLELLPIDV